MVLTQEQTLTIIEALLGIEYQTTIPPRYKAAALGGRGSTVKAWLLTFGIEGNHIRETEYTWFFDNEKIISGIGLTNASFEVTDGKYGAMAIRVIIRNVRKGIDTEKVFLFKAWEPEVAVYQYDGNGQPDPNRDAAFTTTIKSGGNGFMVWPYYFNVANLSALNFNWQTDGGVPIQGRNNIISASRVSELLAKGFKNLNIIVRNPLDIADRAVLKAGLFR
jgi:hypothetical protein